MNARGGEHGILDGDEDLSMLERLGRLLFAFEGRVTRTQYCVAALALVAIKYSVDHTIAAAYHVPWPITVYVLPPRSFTVFGIGSSTPRMFAWLWAIAIPFFWAGISLTLRRLRDAGMRSAWLLLFFVPIANFLLFVALSVLPPSPERAAASGEGTLEVRPDAPLLGFAIAVAIGVLLTIFSATYLAQYAWGLFLGLPFFVGFIASWFLNAKRLQSRTATAAVAGLAVPVVGLLLLGFRFEGMVCLLMAVPLAIPLSIGGAFVARACLANRARTFLRHPGGVSMCAAILPVAMLLEHTVLLEPPVRPVTTSVVIDAPANVVWKNVIAFRPLGPPKEWLFRTGIAYPTGATITGKGAGAIRRCRFSTGDFVEPIVTWDEDRLLAFSVAEQPPALVERSIDGGTIRTPHIERDYLRSRHGQFKLTALDASHTLLEGTTWYQDYFWPQTYWRPWSDAIIHRIHTRVLEHVKAESERPS